MRQAPADISYSDPAALQAHDATRGPGLTQDALAQSLRLGLGGALVVLHAPFLLWLRRIWSHAPADEIILSLLTPLLIVSLLYLRRDELAHALTRRTEADSARVGLVMVIGALMIATLSIGLGHVLPLVISAPLGIHGYLIWTRGARQTQTLMVPVYLSVFLVPWTYGQLSALSIYLQRASANVATWMLQLFGQDAYLDGITIVAEGTYNHVTEACSGMSTLTALLVYGLAFGYILKLHNRHLFSSLAMLVPLALVANAARVAAISLLLIFYGEEVANGPLHNGCGYVAFACVYALLYARMVRYKNTHTPHVAPS